MSTARRLNAIRPSAPATCSNRACGFQPCHAGREDGSHAKRASGQPVAVSGEDDRGRVRFCCRSATDLEPLEVRPNGVRCGGAPRTSSRMLSALQAQRPQGLPRSGVQVERSGRGFPAAHRRRRDLDQIRELGHRAAALLAQVADHLARGRESGRLVARPLRVGRRPAAARIGGRYVSVFFTGRDEVAESVDVGAPAGIAFESAGPGVFSGLESTACDDAAPFVASGSRPPAATVSRDRAGSPPTSAVSSTPRSRKSSSGRSSRRLPMPDNTAAACLHIGVASPHSHDATISPGCGNSPLSRWVTTSAMSSDSRP